MDADFMEASISCIEKDLRNVKTYIKSLEQTDIEFKNSINRLQVVDQNNLVKFNAIEEQIQELQVAQQKHQGRISDLESHVKKLQEIYIDSGTHEDRHNELLDRIEVWEKTTIEAGSEIHRKLESLQETATNLRQCIVDDHQDRLDCHEERLEDLHRIHKDLKGTVYENISNYACLKETIETIIDKLHRQLGMSEVRVETAVVEDPVYRCPACEKPGTVSHTQENETLVHCNNQSCQVVKFNCWSIMGNR